MIRSFLGACIGAIAFVAVSGASILAGADEPGLNIDASDPARILSAVRNHGEAELSSDNMGDPLIAGQIEGREYSLFFYDCSGNRDCKSVMFRSLWQAEDLSDDQMSDWNRNQRFGKSYLDGDDNVVLEMNVNLHGGVSPANLDHTIGWWRFVLGEFADHFDLSGA